MATGGAGTGGPLAFDATASGSMELTAVEVVRVSAVLEDTLEKLSFLSAITPDVVMHKEEAAELTSGEVSRLMAEQHALERKYEDLVAQRALLKGAGNKARFKALQEEIQSVYYQVRESMKGVCRTLRENPDVSENLARIAEEREALASLLEKTLSDLRDGHYRSLGAFVSKEREARAKMRAAVNKEEEVLREVDRLTTTLKEEEERHAADMEARRLEQAELKERLRKLKIDTTLTLRYTRKEAAATTDSAARAYTAAEMAVVDEIEAIRKRAETERRVHDQTLDALRRDQEDFAKQADDWRTKLVTDLAGAEAELARLTAVREAQKAELQKYHERYDAELADLADMEVAERKRQEAEARAKEDAELKRRSATQIQIVFGEMCRIIAEKKAADKEAKAKATEKKGDGKGKKK